MLRAEAECTDDADLVVVDAVDRHGKRGIFGHTGEDVDRAALTGDLQRL